MKYALLLSMSILFFSCRTVHFDKPTEAKPGKADPGVSSLQEEINADKKAERLYAIEEEKKEVDIEPSVIIVEKPVYSPEIVKEDDERLKGADAVKEANKQALQIPTDFVNGTMYYAFDNDWEYEIHTQPYRTTDIVLEPGEQVLEMPYLSEEKVWDIAGGVSRENGLDVQHFFLKPTIHKLTTSMIIITDRRVYHMLLKSFTDRYMVTVKWKYPPRLEAGVKTEAMEERIRQSTNVTQEESFVNPEFLSFDYRMTYSLFKKPIWLPQRVYDDGAKTYIQMDERMLHAESPVLFNNRNERINYRVLKNVIVVDELIEKLTLRRGREKVTIYKKYSKEDK